MFGEDVQDEELSELLRGYSVGCGNKEGLFGKSVNDYQYCHEA